MTDPSVTHSYEVAASITVAEPDADDVFTVARNGVAELLQLLRDDLPVVTVTDFVSENGILVRRVHTNVDLESGIMNTVTEVVDEERDIWERGNLPAEDDLLLTVTIPKGNEGTAYRLTLADGESKIIDETGDQYAELAGIIDDTFPMPDPSKPEEETFEDIQDAQGWNADSVAVVLMDFIDNYADKGALIRFAQKRASEENS